MTVHPFEQRNLYQGDPLRPWIVLRMVAKDGAILDLRLIADTGNPFDLVINLDKLAVLNHGVGPKIATNFGLLEGAWFQLAMPEFGLRHKVYGYGSDEVAAASKESHPDFEGLAGLPLLRLLEYGGNASEFWIRRVLPPS